ncbi:Z-DNA-binding protein 1 isoform X2 [Bufo gargarizans]|uniref:Z-DNA-binding protein 1 isoform X2 n=1 Tax=Bufo gargarizans TaxID=30331 RepID=UPI001CF4DF0D|nr:Z-DNA-binding protein 1 isoform X2 [Bufo gargarizans]
MNKKLNLMTRKMPQTQSEDLAAPDTMAEIADTELPKIACILTPLQKEIYQHLLNKGRQSAMNIAKAVKKERAKEVNPDLYSMKKMNLLEYNSSDKLWNIRAAAARDTGAITAVKRSMSQLTELQKSIFTFLKSNKPSRAITIAKGVGKTTAKDVNPALYRMKALNLLSHDEMEKLWTIDPGITRTVSGSPNPSSEDTSANRDVTTAVTAMAAATGPMVSSGPELNGNLLCPNQSHVEIDDCKLPHKDVRKDSGIKVTSPYTDNTTSDEPNLTEHHTSHYLQHGSQILSAPLIVIKNYQFNIQGCSRFTVGDSTWLNKWDAEPIREANGDINFQYEYRDPDITAHEAEQEQDSALGQSQQSRDNLISELSLLSTDEDEGSLSAPCTSSPMSSRHYNQALNYSGICDALENVTLDDQDNGEQCADITLAEQLLT